MKHLVFLALLLAACGGEERTGAPIDAGKPNACSAAYSKMCGDDYADMVGPCDGLSPRSLARCATDALDSYQLCLDHAECTVPGELDCIRSCLSDKVKHCPDGPDYDYLLCQETRQCLDSCSLF